MTTTTFTPVATFGKDHWSLLAYVETCCIDGKAGIGTLNRRLLRCNGDKRPLLGALTPWRAAYSTRLKGFFDFNLRADTGAAVAAGFQLMDHDDWDCLADLAGAGYVDIQSMVNGFVKLTDDGIRVTGMLRAHKARGAQFATFEL